jgi:hypothetical protein
MKCDVHARDCATTLPIAQPNKRLTRVGFNPDAYNPLETFCTPGGRFTSLEAIERFIERCSTKTRGAFEIQQSFQTVKPDLERAKRAGDELRKLIGRKSKAFK